MQQSINWIALKTIVGNEVRRFMRIWPQSLLPPAITMSLYYLIFGRVIGGRIGPLEGFDYVQYISPGLIMMSVITSAYTNSSFSFFSMKFQRVIEEMMVAPVSNHIIILGYTIGAVVRGLVVALVVTSVSIFFTKFVIVHIWVMLSVIILSATLFALAGLINGIYAENFDQVSIVPTFILTPLTYLGGVFYSVTMLPDLWQRLSHYNPILYMVNAFRYSMLGAADVTLVYSFCILSFSVIALYGFSYYLLVKGAGVKQ